MEHSLGTLREFLDNDGDDGEHHQHHPDDDKHLNQEQKVAKHKARIRLRELLLSLLFRARRKDQAMKEVIQVVTEFPSLATGYYGHRRNFFTPLHCFLVTQASLYQVQDLLVASQYFKEQSLCMCDRDEDLPLHVACKYSSSEIVEYLMEEYPEALRERNDGGCLPLHCALGSPGEPENDDNDNDEDDETSSSQHRISSAVLKEMIELYPESVAMDTNNDRCPLSLALANRCPLEVIQYMIEIYPKSCTDLDIPVAGGSENVYIDMERAKLLAKLLPQLDKLKLDASRWTADALVFFLKELEQNQSISDLGYFALPAQLLRENSDIRIALEHFFQKNTRTKHLHLSVCDVDHYNHNRLESDGEDHLLTALQGYANTSHEVLQLQRFLIKDMNVLGSFLASAAPPKILSFVNVRIIGEHWTLADEPVKHLAFNSRIEKITFGHCHMSDACWASMIQYLSEFPCLKELNICPNAYELALSTRDTSNTSQVVDFTGPLVTLLTKGKLERMALPGFMVDIEAICECLKSNNTLSTFASYPNSQHWENEKAASFCLDLLENHNTTITQILPFSLREDKYPQISHLCRLNWFKRGKFRNPETPMAELISILLRVKLGSLETAVKENPNSDKLSVLYGLLRDAPSFWSTAACAQLSRKRKCPAS